MEILEMEVKKAEALIKILRPCLKRDRITQRFNTKWGDKTDIGLYKTIKRIIESNSELPEE